MAVNPKRRQRKLEKKRAEKKAEKKLMVRRQSQGLAAQIREASTGHVLHAEIANVIWTDGIGNVWVSRELRGGLIGFASFLVDVYCLGVKDCFGGIRPRHDYFSQYSRFTERFETEKVSIECARKFVQGAVDYAAKAEIYPHADYRALAAIFGDADPAACPRDFTYGKDGRPLFIPGPNETLIRSREIMEKLTKRYGAQGFNHLIAFSDPNNVGGFLPAESDGYSLEGPEGYDANLLDDDDDDDDEDGDDGTSSL